MGLQCVAMVMCYLLQSSLRHFSSVLSREFIGPVIGSSLVGALSFRAMVGVSTVYN